MLHQCGMAYLCIVPAPPGSTIKLSSRAKQRDLTTISKFTSNEKNFCNILNCPDNAGNVRLHLSG